ncbi:hypothetical protein V757_04770 [Pelistega indica]|uniref:Uncharacterized protein n=1 Tax=Pelistega indica TaxID=1414851 RepID=V8G7F4_9BURK|nr:hypothetical protein V757_04770 [Pelistega indica]
MLFNLFNKINSLGYLQVSGFASMLILNRFLSMFVCKGDQNGY